MTNTVKILTNAYKDFKNINTKLNHIINDKNCSNYTPKLVNIYNNIVNEVASVSDNIDFHSDTDIRDAISGDNGDIEDGANMLRYYQELIAETTEQTSLDTVNALMIGGAKITNPNLLYVNYAFDEPDNVKLVSASMLADGVVSDILFDLKHELEFVQAHQVSVN